MLIHRLAQLAADLGYPPAVAAVAADQLAQVLLLVGDVGVGRLGRPVVARMVGCVLPGAAAEHQCVEQRVRAEAVAAVDRHARDLARRVEARDLGEPVDVGLDAAHRVVVARLDVDRLAGDVDAGEVAADVHDLPQRLVDPLPRHLRDVERDRAVREPAPLVDLGLLRARDDVA